MAEEFSMGAADAELDKVLRPLTGPALYRDNVFRITGLPIDATPSQVRRRREEAAMTARFGAPAGAVDGAVDWRQPDTDGETLRNAFEALRNPVLRLCHELLWLRPDLGAADPHNVAVNTHGSVLEQTLHDPEWHTDDEDRAARWSDSLDHWQTALSGNEMWDRAKRRVREIDDPRLTLATVRRLQERLPELIVGVSVTLAAHAVRSDDIDTADQHLEQLASSRFSAEIVRRVRRDVAEPAQTRIETACETAERESGPGKGVAPLHRLLADVDAPLQEVDTLLADDDPVVEALADRIATTINARAVDHFNESRDGAAVQSLLQRALEFSVDPEITDLVRKNLAVVESELGGGASFGRPAADAPALGDDVPGPIATMCGQGGVNAAAARVRAWRRWTKDPVMKARLGRVLADPTALVSPVQQAPGLGCFFFLGGGIHGTKALRAYGPDGRPLTANDMSDVPTERMSFGWVGTYFLTFLWIPILPLGAYLVRQEWSAGRAYLGRVPLGARARWYRLLMLVALPVAVVAYVLGTVAAAYTAAGLVAFTVVCLVLRQVYLYSWVRRYT